MNLHCMRSLTLFLLSLVILISIVPSTTYSSSVSFTLISYFVKSSANTSDIYPGSRNVQLTIEVKYNGTESLVGVFGKISLPSGFSISRGSQSVSPPYNPNGTTYSIVSPGDVIIFRYLFDVSENTNPGTYPVTLTISYRVAGSLSTGSTTISGIIVIVSPYPSIRLNVIDTYWSPAGYPGSEGVSLNLVIENTGDSDIVSGHIKVELPSTIDPNKVELDIGALNKKNRMTITLNNLAISPDASPGKSYSANLVLEATARTDDGVTYNRQTSVTFSITISKPPTLKFVLIDYGIEPSYISDKVKAGSVYLVLENKGFITINSLTAIFRITHGGKFVRGSYCVVTLSGTYRYGDVITLRSDQVIFSPGSKEIGLKISIEAFGSKDGAEFWSSSSYTITISVSPNLSKSKGLQLISSDWQNGYPVYPNTSNATFIITLVNKWPYTIYGISLNLSLPSGFYSSNPEDKQVSTAYIPGPVNSLDTMSASFTISVANVTSGIYKAKLYAQYIVVCDNNRIEQHEEYDVHIRVHSLKEAVELILTTWYGGSPEPNTYGAPLLILIRNNYVPTIKGLVLELYLPQGFTCSLNNASYAKLTPYAVGRIPLSQVSIKIPVRNLAELTRYLAGQQPSTATLNPGDIATFLVPINIASGSIGEYKAMGILNFIDQWGNVRKVKISIPFSVLGSVRVIDVIVPNSISFVNGEAYLNMTLINRGSAPIYDTYVALIPRSPLAIPVQNYKYVGKIEAHGTIIVSFLLKYNPTNVISMGGGMALQYSTLPLILTVMYKDALGYSRIFNISVAVLIEPFVDVRIGSDTKAIIDTTGSLVVSGTIINYGIAQARSVEVIASANGVNASTFIGDLDPASQTAFRIELPQGVKANLVNITIAYRDNYDRLMFKSYTIRVSSPTTTATQTTTETRHGITIPSIFTGTNLLIIGIVTVFLISVFILIYRLVKSHSRRLAEATRV